MFLYSIIVPVYNVADYLEECLTSIINQTYTNWELILVDDGSTDQYSSFICDNYAGLDRRIRVFHEKNRGSLMTRRYGIQQANGDYFLFVDSDDYLHKDLLLTVNEIITKTKSDLVLFRFQFIGGIKKADSPIIFKEGTTISKNNSLWKQLWQKIVSGTTLNNLYTKVVKRETLDIEADYSMFAFLNYGTDLIQSLPILANAQKIYVTEKVLYYYRFNPTGISSVKKKQTDLRSIDEHLQTWNILHERKLYYLKKIHFDSDENIKSVCKCSFQGCMDLLISWFMNEKDSKKRKQIVNKVLQEEKLTECRNQLCSSDFSGKYRTLFKLIDKENDLMHCLRNLAFNEKVMSIIRNILYSINRIISKIKR